MSTQDLHDSIALGIEALKRIQGARNMECFASTSLLPGETKELSNEP